VVLDEVPLCIDPTTDTLAWEEEIDLDPYGLKRKSQNKTMDISPSSPCPICVPLNLH